MSLLLTALAPLDSAHLARRFDTRQETLNHPSTKLVYKSHKKYVDTESGFWNLPDQLRKAAVSGSLQ